MNTTVRFTLCLKAGPRKTIRTVGSPDALMVVSVVIVVVIITCVIIIFVITVLIMNMIIIIIFLSSSSSSSSSSSRTVGCVTKGGIYEFRKLLPVLFLPSIAL